MTDLGPHYALASRFSEQLFRDSLPDDFKPVIERFQKDISSKIEDYFREWVLSDTEANVQGFIWRTVDDMVKAILTGEPWAIERYDHEKVREAVARHAGDEVLKLRIKDLEEQVKQQEETIKWLRR